MINGILTYHGPSDIDGRTIKSIVTGTHRPSENPKTGDVLQQYVMPTNSKPTDAIQNGDDYSVCGDCVHRPSLAKYNDDKECYVNLGHVNGIYKAAYPMATNLDHERDAPLRFGAWGESAAIPFDINIQLIRNGRPYVGYTHQWANPNIDPRYKTIFMASVDSSEQQMAALKLGWRTFRVRKNATVPLLPSEIMCPASKEGGQRVTCSQCRLCSGTSRQAKNIITIEH